jgi:hypothetical protein
MSLTDTAARGAKARDKAYKLSDAKGLYCWSIQMARSSAPLRSIPAAHQPQTPGNY